MVMMGSQGGVEGTYNRVGFESVEWKSLKRKVVFRG